MKPPGANDDPTDLLRARTLRGAPADWRGSILSSDVNERGSEASPGPSPWSSRTWLAIAACWIAIALSQFEGIQVDGRFSGRSLEEEQVPTARPTRPWPQVSIERLAATYLPGGTSAAERTVVFDAHISH